jgi:hypothetical protein
LISGDVAALSAGSAGTSVTIDRITASYIASARSRARCFGGVESKVSTAPVPAAWMSSAARLQQPPDFQTGAKPLELGGQELGDANAGFTVVAVQRLNPVYRSRPDRLIGVYPVPTVVRVVFVAPVFTIDIERKLLVHQIFSS